MNVFRKELIELLKEPKMPDEVLRLHMMKLLGPPYPKAKISYEEFLEWLDEDILAEWVDGEVIMASPASKMHQDIVFFIGKLVDIFVRYKKLGEVLTAPFQMKLENSGREPDLLFVKTENLSRFKKTYLDGPADVVLEIISPESGGRDRGDKFYEYERAGIPEYWLIDPQKNWFEVYRVNNEGIYESAFSGKKGKYSSDVLPGFWLNVEWLWQSPLPDALDVLWEIAPGIFERYQK